MILKDKQIRTALKKNLSNRRPLSPFTIDELYIHNGNAIADLVAFTKKSIHCYEIKGQTDSIGRLTKQSSFYDLAFPKLTVVTTSNHIKWAEKNLATHWGIIVAETKNDKVILNYKRKAENNPFFSKKQSLMILWKKELVDIAENFAGISHKSSYTREDLAIKIASALRKDTTLALIKRALTLRAL